MPIFTGKKGKGLKQSQEDGALAANEMTGSAGAIQEVAARAAIAASCRQPYDIIQGIERTGGGHGFGSTQMNVTGTTCARYRANYRCTGVEREVKRYDIRSVGRLGKVSGVDLTCHQCWKVVRLELDVFGSVAKNAIDER